MTFLSFTKISATLLISVSSLFAVPQFSSAQQRIKFSPPTPPPSGVPGGRGNAGRRGCNDAYPDLKALVPSPIANDPQQPWGLTTSDRTTIWFDIPTGIKDEGTLIEWRLRDAKGKTLYRTSGKVGKTEKGVISISTPATMPLANATYQWDLAIFCQSGNSSSVEAEGDAPLIRKGALQRVAMPAALQKELTSAKTPLDRAKGYAKYGFWYDALTTVGEQLRSSPNNAELRAVWNDLLRQQKLNGKTTETITQCCTLEPQK
jgi:Domain of Unknown Function (DUF928)